MSASSSVIERLRRMNFRLREDGLDLFGESMHMVKAIAVDEAALQLVLVAEQEARPRTEQDLDAMERRWRELIFAIGGLRHQLRGADAPALGAPILIAVVPSVGVDPLRSVVEEIARDYALLARVEINILNADLEDDAHALDRALSSCLPLVRKALEERTTVITQDVAEFWAELRAEVQRGAEGVGKDFGHALAEEAAHQVLGQLEESIAVRKGGDPEPGPSPVPISKLELRSFRSFQDEQVDLPSVAIVYGSNGGGKTSLCEALELAWSGWTQRIPDQVTSKEYTAHLARDGGEPFSVRWQEEGHGHWQELNRVDEFPSVPIGRTVLAQHLLAEMASSSPKDRFRAFLATSGLDLPDLENVAGKIRALAREEADAALGEANFPPLRAVNASSRSHLSDKLLEVAFATRLPSRDEVGGAADALEKVSAGAFVAREAVSGSELRPLLIEIDSAIAELAKTFEGPDPRRQMDEAATALRKEALQLRERADPLRRMASHMRESWVPRQRPPEARQSPSPIPRDVAVRWVSHARGLREGFNDLERLAPRIDHDAWRARLDAYLHALRKAQEQSSLQDLEALVSKEREEAPQEIRQVSELPFELIKEAGFIQMPKASPVLVEGIDQMQLQLSRYAARLDELAAELDRHPAREFVARAHRLLPALCRFELARDLLQPTGAITRTRESLLNRLLEGRLFPLVQELVDALVRFEWYFQPMRFQVKGTKMHLSGLATSNEKLDVRLLLNAAERSIVGVAWFLALHVLQPRDHRRVLVLDDPASGFDPLNQAAFVATLRALLRLLEPEQLVITTHDETFVALLEQELAAVAGWPSRVSRYRCRRGSSGVSEVDEVPDGDLHSGNLDRELQLLAFEEETAGPASAASPGLT
jgi:hypothetical protein